MYDKGEKTILKESRDVVLAEWGNEYVTWVKGCRGDFAWGHYFSWYNCTKEQAYKDALDDFNKRVFQYEKNRHVPVNVYYRIDNTLDEGVGFQLFGNCLKNCCVEYTIPDDKLEALYDGHMIIHGDLVIIPIHQEE